MNTLAEIEAAVESLPYEKKEELLRFLIARLRNPATSNSHQIPLTLSRRGFPASKGRIPFTSADVARAEMESDTHF